MLQKAQKFQNYNPMKKDFRYSEGFNLKVLGPILWGKTKHQT